MTIDTDFAIDYTNKRIWNKYAWGQGGTETIYTVNALYSWLMNAFDEQGAMDDDVPMSAQTPNAYSFINEWFIDDDSTHYLKEGAIVTIRGDTKIALLTFSSTSTPPQFSDIGKQVVWGATERGPLLAYNLTTLKWWVRTTAVPSPPTAITITGSSAAGTCSAVDNTGEDLFANVYTLGTIETGTDVYIYQAGVKLGTWGYIFTTGHIDRLIKVMEYGTEIDGALVTLYAHVYTDLYDHFETDLGAGGRNAVPLATADDMDNQTVIADVLNYMDTIRIMFVNGTIPYSGAAGDSPIKHMVIHGLTSHATAHILNTSSPFELGSIVGTFQNAEAIEILEEVKFDGQTALFTTIPQVISSSSGGSGTLRRIIQNPQGPVSNASEGILFLSEKSGTFADNDTLTGSAQGSAVQLGAIITNTFTANTTATVTFASTVLRDLGNPDPQSGPQPYNVIIDLNGSHVKELYEFVKSITRRTSTIQTYPTNGTDTLYAYNGEFYQKANTTYTAVKKASPLGIFAGGKFFGAKGIWIEDMIGTEVESFVLTDAEGDTVTPPQAATLKVVAMIATNDRVLVCESTAENSTIIKKNQYTCASQSGDRNYIEVTTAIADDAPPTNGVIRVVRHYGLGTTEEFIFNYTTIDRTLKRFMITPNTTEAFDSDDRAYNPYIDTLADGSGNREVALKYSMATKYIVTRVRLNHYIPFQVAGSFAAGLTTITAIRTPDGINP